MLCAFVPLEGSQIEVLPPSTSPIDVLEQGPLHCIDCGHDGWKLYWTSGSYHLKEVNELASGFAKQLVKGDACLVHPTSQQHILERLLQSRQCRRAAGMGKERCSAIQNISLSAVTQEQQTISSPQPCCGRNCSIAPLASAASPQHTATANDTRHRILSSMGPLDRHLPGQLEARIGPSSSKDPGAQHNRSRPCPYGAEPDTTGTIPGTPPRHEQKKLLQCPRGQIQSLGRADDCPCCKHSLLLGCSTAQNSSSHSSSSRGCMQNAISTPTATSVDVGGFTAGAQTVAVPVETHKATFSAAITTSLSTSSSSCVPSSKLPRCDQQPALLTSATASTAPTSPSPPVRAWDELPEDVVGRVAGHLGQPLSAVMPMYSTCRSWQRAVLDNDQLLSKVRFRLDPARPFKPLGSQHTAAAPVAAYQHWQHRAIKQQHPALLERASRSSNVSAIVTRARLLDTAADLAGAMRLWRRAAKFGHVEAQLVFGLAQYRGSAGLAQDPEEAHMWLNKALKQVQKQSIPVGLTSNSTSTRASNCRASANSAQGELPNTVSSSISTSLQISSVSSSDPTSSTCPARKSSSDSLCDTIGMPGTLSARVQAQAGLVLGYLSFDGEGTRSDKQEAVKLFKLAAAAAWGRESREAAQVLGWIWNTGQY